MAYYGPTLGGFNYGTPGYKAAAAAKDAAYAQSQAGGPAGGQTYAEQVPTGGGGGMTIPTPSVTQNPRVVAGLAGVGGMWTGDPVISMEPTFAQREQQAVEDARIQAITNARAGDGGGVIGGLRSAGTGSSSSSSRSAYEEAQAAAQAQRDRIAEMNRQAEIDAAARTQVGGIDTGARTQSQQLAEQQAQAEAALAAQAAEKQAGYGMVSQQSSQQSEMDRLLAQGAAQRAAQLQAEQAAAAAAEKQFGYGAAAMNQQAGIDTGARIQQGDIDTAARTQTGQIAAGGRTQESELQAAAEARRLAQMPQLLAGLGLGGGGATIQPPDTSAAQEAAWLRAKDRTGQVSRSALTALQNAMVTRGIQGSGLEAAGTGGLMGQGAAELSDVAREQAIQDVNTQTDWAKTKYQGDITQRGQNASLAPSLMGLFSARY
jgi:hypothetical protein